MTPRRQAELEVAQLLADRGEVYRASARRLARHPSGDHLDAASDLQGLAEACDELREALALPTRSEFLAMSARQRLVWRKVRGLYE